jgi:phage repressor protein C with HTH and peptisase S24 domain
MSIYLRGILMEIDDIIKKALFYGGFKTRKELAKWLDIDTSAISQWKRGKNIPERHLKKIEKLISNESNDLLSDIDKIEKSLNDTNMVSINYYEDISASAGYGSSNEEIAPVKMEFDKLFLEKILNIKQFDNLDIIRVVGDSMLPYIKDGEYVVVEKTINAKSGDTVIANIDGELYIKRLKTVPFEKWLTLESVNNEYPSIILDTQERLEALTIIGIMRSKIKLY